MRFRNTHAVPLERPVGKKVCGEVMISGDWLALCILPPHHAHPAAGATTHLPSPYLERAAS